MFLAGGGGGAGNKQWMAFGRHLLCGPPSAKFQLQVTTTPAMSGPAVWHENRRAGIQAFKWVCLAFLVEFFRSSSRKRLTSAAC